MVFELVAQLRAAFDLPYRQLEGKLRELCWLLGMDREAPPDYSTLSPRLPELPLPMLPAPACSTEVVVIIDSTGVRISEAQGWHQARPYAGDSRKV